MKLLFVGHNADLYGASRSLLRLTSRLARDGHDVTVVLPEAGALEGVLAANGVAVRALADLAIVDRKSFASWRGRASWPVSIWRSRQSLLRLLRAVKPDLVHTNSSVVPSAGWAARAAGIPHVQHVREFYTDFGPLWPLYRRWLQRHADRICCVSEAVAAQFTQRGNVVVLPNGFPRDEFPPVDPERAAAFRAQHHIPADAPLAGVVGRIKLKRKGQETFLAAAELLRDQMPAAHFALVGSPFPGNESHEVELRRQVAKAGLTGRVAFCGEAAEVGAVYAALDLVVLASGTPEPFGGVVIEAMIYARAVIGTNIGGTPEQILDGKTGLLVPPNDPAAMAAALRALLGDEPLRRRMGEAGRQRYLDRFEFEPFYARLMTLYREVIG